MASSRFTILIKKERGFEKIVDTVSRLFDGAGWYVNRTHHPEYVLIQPRSAFRNKSDLVVAIRRFIIKDLYLERLIITDNTEQATK